MGKDDRTIIPTLARNPVQQEQYEQIAKDGVCPFCGDNFTKYHKKPILFENNSWLVTENENPYKGTRLHLLLVFKLAHIKSMHELSPAAMGDLLLAHRWAEDHFKIESGVFLMRFGNPGDNGASVEHLHAHIIVGEGVMSDTAERVRAKVGYHSEK